jgi:hypothetical protein
LLQYIVPLHPGRLCRAIWQDFIDQQAEPIRQPELCDERGRRRRCDNAEVRRGLPGRIRCTIALRVVITPGSTLPFAAAIRTIAAISIFPPGPVGAAASFALYSGRKIPSTFAITRRAGWSVGSARFVGLTRRAVA